MCYSKPILLKGFVVFNDSPLWLVNLSFSIRRSCVTNSFVFGGEGKGDGGSYKYKNGGGGGGEDDTGPRSYG